MPTTAAIQFQISQSFEVFFQFLKFFFRKRDGRVSVRIEYALGVEIGPLSRSRFVDFYILSYRRAWTRARLGFIFRFHRRAWFWIWVCPKKQDFFKRYAFSFEKMVDYARPGDQKLSSSGGPIWVTFRMSVLNPAGGDSIGFGGGAVFGPLCRVGNQNKVPSRIVRDKKIFKKMTCQGGANLVPQRAPFSTLSQFSTQNAFAKPPQLHQD